MYMEEQRLHLARQQAAAQAQLGEHDRQQLAGRHSPAHQARQPKPWPPAHPPLAPACTAASSSVCIACSTSITLCSCLCSITLCI